VIRKEKKACDACDDTGWRPIEENGVRRVVRCDCWLDGAGRTRIAHANIPKRYQHCTFQNFLAYNDSLARAVAYAQDVIKDFPARTSDRDQGLLLIGEPGVGKTHLAVAMLKQCIYRGGTGLFHTTSDLMALLRSTYTGQETASESSVLRTVSTADVIVFDELGRERATEWRDEMLHLIVNARYSNRLLTIFTTNYDIADDRDPDALQCRVGMRVFSRLHEMCELMHLDAADYRERPTNAGPDDLIAMWKMRRKAQPLPAPGRGGRQARAQMRDAAVRDGRADLKWPGGRAGS
jgi:DNA replication protein DnaC